MPEDNDKTLVKARFFFERARKVAETRNFDYAIELYLEGLRCVPDEVEHGHLGFHELALQRQAKGGKKPSMVEKVKFLRGKNALERMLNAEYLFAKAPEHLAYAEAMLKAAVEGDYRQTAKWIADLIFQANNAASKPSLHRYILLKDSYASIGQYDRAAAACQHAARLKPEDGELADEFKKLSAEMAVARGKYDQAGDFRKSIKDREVQEKLQAQQSVVKTEDYRISAVNEARKAFALEPSLPQNIFNLAEALSDVRSDEADTEAIELLEKTYKAKNDFSFMEWAGRIKIKHFKRKVKEAKIIFEANPEDSQAQAKAAEFSEQLKKVELEHYCLCVANYPTDLQAKYEYAVRLVVNERYDDAIPLFQEAQKDLRHKILAMGKIGLCFFMKGWYADAIDIFTKAINAYETKEDNTAKELRYNLARSYEQQGDMEKALEIFRKIAQLDFAYRDVRQRVDNMRGQPDANKDVQDRADKGNEPVSQ